MYHVSPVRILMIITVLVLSVTFSQAQDALLPVVFKSEGSQISLTLRKEFLPAISQIGMDVFTPEVKKVHGQIVPAGQSLVWQMQEMSRYTEGETFLYLCAVILKPIKGEPHVVLGRIMQSGKKLEFRLMTERPDNLPGPGPVEFHKSMTEAMPNNGVAWFFYGQAICDKHQDGMGFSAISLTPPPPPPPAPPSLPGMGAIKEIQLSKEELKQIAEDEKQWKAKHDALLKDLKVAQPFFLKAAEVADDCQIKDVAMAYLAAIAREFEDGDGERQWLLKRIEHPCATNSVKAESYYALGVKQWAGAYELSGKYASKKAADPFHFRSFTNPADKQKFDRYVAAADEYLEKALGADPNFVDAMFYQSLIYREKQKVTANLAERKKLGDQAIKIANQATEMMKRREK